VASENVVTLREVIIKVAQAAVGAAALSGIPADQMWQPHVMEVVLRRTCENLGIEPSMLDQPIGWKGGRGPQDGA
jgi:hypothetical protein